MLESACSSQTGPNESDLCGSPFFIVPVSCNGNKDVMNTNNAVTHNAVIQSFEIDQSVMPDNTLNA
jgi:hypothetical protein